MRDPTGVDVLTKNSPNRSAWVWGEKGIRRIALHTPEGPWESVINTVMSPHGRRVSYHRLLHSSGKRAIQFVPWSKKAWHVGDYNSRMEGLAACCFADQLSPAVEGLLARTTAWRLLDRGIPCRYEPSRDPLAYGFCRHGDLQDDRSDPMTAARFKRVIVPKVRFWYREYQTARVQMGREAELRSRTGFFAFAAWFLGEGAWKQHGRRNMSVRPDVPTRVPTEWWARLTELVAKRG